MPISAATLRAIADTMMRGGADARAALDAVFTAVQAQEEQDLLTAREAVLAKRQGNRVRKRDQRLRDSIATGAASPAPTTTHAATPPDLFDTAYATDAPDASPRDVMRDQVTPVTDVMRDQPPSSFSPTPPLITPSIGVGGVGARGADDLISKQAGTLADQVIDIMGIDRAAVPTGWHATALYLQNGLSGGWRPEIVLIAAREVRAQLLARRAPLPHTCRYLTNPINRAHQEHQQGFTVLGVVSGSRKEKSHASRPARGQRRGGFAGGVLDYVASAHDQAGDTAADPAQERPAGGIRSAG